MTGPMTGEMTGDSMHSEVWQPDGMRSDSVPPGLLQSDATEVPHGPGALRGRTALVSGAGNGLGRAIAGALAAEGVRVILTGRTEATLKETLAGLPSGDDRIAVCDVSDPAAVTALASEVSNETVSILVNNAGIAGPVKSLWEIEPREWDEVFDANVRSVYLMCRAFLPPMIERGAGDVINLASVSGKRPLARRTPYTASKMAVIGLTRTLAFEAGPYGVSVNTLSPGPVRGPRMERNFRLEAAASGGSIAEAEHAFVSRAALNRLVEEDEVAAAVLAMLRMPGLCGADIDLSAGMIGT
jgi:NAD(P)-dependent dehydrogenase (short-subunit alcohol dehydrogenase family)